MTPIKIARFWSKVRVSTKKPCWLWTGGTSGAEKYGVFHGQRAHRVSYTLFNGPIPDGAVIRHTCDNPRCVNPHHLLTGTQADNIRDAVLRKRIRYGGGSGRAKLSDADVVAIRLNPDRRLNVEMARHYGVSQAVISSVKAKKTWRHLP